MKPTPPQLLPLVTAALALSAAAFSQTLPPTHVPPDPPQHELGEMSYAEMAEMMQMDDKATFGAVRIDQAEWRWRDGESKIVWDGKAWFGGDINKLEVRTEGERTSGETQDAHIDLFWDRLIGKWWSLQTGARRDFGTGPSRTWAAIGVEGETPFWLEVEATFYAGEQGRTAARVKIEQDVLITQRLILQPELEANAYGKSDAGRGIKSGLSDIDAGLRMRYEIRREIAPYVGVSYQRFFTEKDESDLQLSAGIRIWF